MTSTLLRVVEGKSKVGGIVFGDLRLPFGSYLIAWILSCRANALSRLMSPLLGGDRVG